MTDVLAELEKVAARDIGRGSRVLAAHSQGDLRAAAESLLATSSPRVVVITGFYIPDANPPACETDGPVGAVQLAAAIISLGGSVRLLTDEPCEPVVAVAAEAAGLDVPIDVAPLPGYTGDSRYPTWAAEAVGRYETMSHVIAIERPGPGVDGAPHTMRGTDISAYTAPLDCIYSARHWYRIGIGDGGNELGMGSLPRQIVAKTVTGGDRIRCVVDCDALIVGGTSNWAAGALVAALAYLTRFEPEDIIKLLRPDWSQYVLSEIVNRAGAVDGVLGQPRLTVDGLDWPEYIKPLKEMLRLVQYGTESAYGVSICGDARVVAPLRAENSVRLSSRSYVSTRLVNLNDE